ncbi:MAG: GDSL-type esterase/lipase family protein [Bacteroidota bacterium]
MRKPFRIAGLTALVMALFLMSGCGTAKQRGIFTPDLDYFKYTGRIDWSDPQAPRMWAPGITVSFAMKDTACTLFIDDEQRFGENQNYLEIVVDDTLHYRVQTRGKSDSITVVNGLAKGEHTVVICKATESLIGYIDFKGVRCAELLPFTVKETRLIEFIGNSITSGFGNDMRYIPCHTGKWFDEHNAWYSYGPIAARELNAQWVLSSNSGIGMIHSCCDKGYIMPEVYETVTLEPGGAAWAFDTDIPDLVTICLGQNDGIQDSAKMVDGYMAFLETVRKHYPAVPVICLSSPMANEELQVYQKMILRTVNDLSLQKGDSLVYSYNFSKQWVGGCDAHPTIEEDEEIAAELTAFIRHTLGW